MAGELAAFDVYWQVFSGGSYVTIGGELSSSETTSVSLIDITNKADTEDRELLEGAGDISKDLTIELVYSDDSGFKTVSALENEIVSVRQIRDSVAQTPFDVKLSSVSASSQNGGYESYSVTLNSSGVV